MLIYCRYRAQYSKKTKRWRPVALLKPKAYSYIPDLLVQIFQTRTSVPGQVDQRIVRSAEDPRNIAPNIAIIPRPTVQQLLSEHKSRFTTE